MGIRELLLLAVGLSMDAFAVAVCKGLSVGKPKPQHYLLIGLWFGGFQALMPTVGYFLGSLFKSYVDRVSSWIAFVLLMLIGANMIREAFSKETNEEKNASFAPLAMLLLAIATSIDALAVGVAFAMDNVNIALAAPIIGVATFLLSALGLRIGSVFGLRYKNKAEFVGGRDMGMGSGNKADVSVKIIAEGNFFRSGFAVNINQNRINVFAERI